ncbi:MAG: VWA domain-containing protein [Planctomycetes bacterium]|nr:VWA domain-containing protein [Planctomycetota bacterium]
MSANAAAAPQDPVPALKSALGNNDHDAKAAQSAIDAAVAAAAPGALEPLMTALDRYGELLGKSEVDAARGRSALANETEKDPAKDPAKDDAAAQARKDRQVALDGALASGSKQQQMLDVVARGVPALLSALAAKPQSIAVPLLFEVYEESSRRIQELERAEETLKGELAQLSSRLFTKEGEALADPKKADRGERDRLASEKAEKQAKVERTVLLLELRRTAQRKLVDATGAVLRGAKGPDVDDGLKQIERRVDGKAAPGERALWVDLYARLGREEVPGELLGVSTEMSRTIKRGEADLTKLREQYEKVKEQYFHAVETGNGTITVAQQNQFLGMQKAVGEATAAALALDRLRTACGRAIGAAVASLPEGMKRDKGVTTLLNAAKSERELETRVAVLEGMGVADLPLVREALRKILVDDKDVKARLGALEALVEMADGPAIEVARTRLLVHENWRVRVAAISALARVPQKESIAPLIEALAVEQGRVLEDATQALQLLTGQTFAMSAPVWQRWWDESKAKFVLADALRPAKPRVAAWEQESAGNVTFYGIKSVSKRICFVLDVSKSMLEKASAGSERTKIEVAKEQLKQAITALADGDQFAIVIFAGSATRWSNKVTTVTAGVKQKVLEWIESKIELDSGTNIHAGMREAFSITGMGTRDTLYNSAIDTMFFLSDGDATVGEIQDPLEIRRLVREWNKLSRIRIHTIGVGEAPNVALLYGLAEDSGGQFQKR